MKLPPLQFLGEDSQTKLYMSLNLHHDLVNNIRSLTCDAGFSFEQVIEYQSPEVSLLGREALQVESDLELHMLPHGGDPLGGLVLAQEVLLTPSQHGFNNKLWKVPYLR